MKIDDGSLIRGFIVTLPRAALSLLQSLALLRRPGGYGLSTCPPETVWEQYISGSRLSLRRLDNP